MLQLLSKICEQALPSDILTQDEIGSNLSTASQWWDRLTVTWLACLDLFYIPLAMGHICPGANYKKEQGFIPACLKIWAGPACPDPIYLNAIGLPRTNSPQFAWQLATTNLFDKIRIWTGCLNPGYKRIQLTSKDWRSMVCLTISYFQLVKKNIQIQTCSFLFLLKFYWPPRINGPQIHLTVGFYQLV